MLEKTSIPKSTNTKGSKYTVLLIEDDYIARHTAQYFLETAGFKVHALPDAEEGFKFAKSHPVNLIITDVGLPGMDGNEFSVLFRYWEKVSHRAPLPIIGLSSHASKQSKLASFEAGMNVILEKPLNEKKVTDVLNLLTNDDMPASSSITTNELESSLSRLSVGLPEEEAELFAIKQYPLFDEVQGLKSAGSIENLTELIHVLTEETIPQELVNLKKAHQAEDWDSLQKIAHKLKGAALYCGNIRMCYACQYFERYRLAGHSILLEELYQQLVETLEETVACVQGHLKTS